MASPGHALGHCKVKCTLCSGQQVWWSLHWGLCSAVQVACVACGFVTFRSPSAKEPVLVKHCAQSPASVWVVSPVHALSHCKVKCFLLCIGQQVWWTLHWGLCLAVQVACVASGFVTFWSPSVMEAVLGNHCAQSPASV